MNTYAVAFVEMMECRNMLDVSAAVPALFAREVHAGSILLTSLAAVSDSG